MNELRSIFQNVNDGDEIILEKDRIYDVRPEDSFNLKGFFCSNTAKRDENPEGTRYTAIYLDNKRNITIDGNGATVMVHGKMTPMLFYGCENITVKNLAVDYKVPTMTEFTVLGNDDGIITIKINDDCLYRVEGNILYWHGEENENGEYYWENACNAPKRYFKVFEPVTEHIRDFRREDLTFTRIEELGNNTLRCTLSDRSVTVNVGEIFETRNIIRDQTGSMFERCKNLTFENLRVKFMHGLGMVNQFSENITFRNCDFTPKEGRTIASTADFFQFSGCKGKILIENCKARGAQDDYVNVHGTHLRIIDVSKGEKSMLVRFMHPESWGFQAFGVGDGIEFIRWDTLQSYNSAMVTSYEKVNDTDIKVFCDFIPDDIIIGKDVIENVTYTPDLTVRSCDFGPTSGRGILCTTRGEVIIENNRFRKLWGPALLIEDDCNFWFESGLTKSITFCNNEVISCNIGKTWEGAPVIQVTPKIMNERFKGFVHEKLNVTGNRFISPPYGKHTFCLEYLREAEIKDNYFDAPFEILSRNLGNITE